MERNTLITLCGEDENALFTIIREVSIARVYILHSKKDEARAKKLEKKLKGFHIPTKRVALHEYRVEEIFKNVAHICEGNEERTIINAATGDKIGSCLLLSAAFVNGIKAVGVMNGKTILLPVMKFSYYSLISERKLVILHMLKETGEVPLNVLAKKIKMSLPLLSYHIHGNGRNEGLLGMGLIEIKESKKKSNVKLSVLGEMLLCGYI